MPAALRLAPKTEIDANLGHQASEPSDGFTVCNVPPTHQHPTLILLEFEDCMRG
jgi:hypothetical protein